jgi:hypothetical protein
MAISRPFLLALLGAVLLGATFFAVQNARDNSGDDAAPAAQQSAPEQQAAKPAEPASTASPQELLEAAFQGGQVESTAFDATITGAGDDSRLSLEVSGAFERGAANDVPEVDVNLQIAANGERAEGGFVSLGDEAYFTRGETGWRVPDEVWSPLVEAVASGGAAEPQSLALPFDPQTWIRDVRSEGTETLDGVETTHVAAAVDVRRVLRDVFPLARLNGAELPSVRDAASTVKRADFDVWVGTDDRVLRRLSADVAFATPPALRGPGDSARSEISLDLRLTDVNQPQDIEAPADVRPGMPGGAFGELAEGLVSGLSGLGGAQPVSLAALTSPNPQRAARAVADGKKVVILFQNPDALDDRAMRRVVNELDGRTKALVLVDHVDTVDRYGKLVEDLGVSQTPSVVLIDRTGEARLIEGYVDTDTLAQAVADAR